LYCQIIEELPLLQKILLLSSVISMNHPVETPRNVMLWSSFNFIGG